MTDEKEIMRRVVETCGGEHQERILLEELLELSIAILHKRRGRPHNMAEEIADVEIAMEEVKIAYGLHDEVSAYREAKLNRLSQELRLNQTLDLFSGREEGENHGREENPCALPLHGL